MKKLVLFITLSILISCSFSSQKEQAILCAEKQINNNPQSALSILNNAQDNFCTYSKKNKMHFLLLKAEAMNKAFIPMDTINYMEQVLDYFLIHGNNSEKVMANYMMGAVYRDKGNSPIALKYLKNAINVSNALDKSTRTQQYIIYSQIIYLYSQMNYANKVLETARQARDLARKYNDTLNYLINTDEIGRAYYLLDNKQAAYKLFTYTYSEFKRLKKENLAARFSGPVFAQLLEQKEFSKAKVLIDEYEEKSGLWDKQNGPLQPGIEIHYYYLGKYYEGISKNDSALWCYHKLLSYPSNLEALENGYKGLMSVYHTLGKADSVMKYAHLYTDANDTANIRNSAQEVIRMQALYDYSESQNQAKEKAEESQMLWRVLCIISMITLIVIMALYVVIKSYKKRNKKYMEKLEEANQKHMETLYQYKDMQKENKKLQLTLKTLQKDPHEAQWDLAQSLLHHPLIIRLHTLASRAASASNAEWKALDETIAQYLPDFYTSLNKYRESLNYREYYICILIRLEFIPTELAALFGIRPQNITNLKNSINRKIFGENGASSLSANISKL